MQDWITKLEGFLTLNDREILKDAGKVSAQITGSIKSGTNRKKKRRISSNAQGHFLL